MENLTISVDVDTEAYRRDANTFVDTKLIPAIAAGINRTAFRARDRLRAEVQTRFDRPTEFTKNAFGVFPAKSRPEPGRDPAALVTVMQMQARYLGLQVFGGMRKAGDYATTRRGSVVPGRDAVRDASGNLPRNYIRDAMRAGADWVDLPGQLGPTLIDRRDGRVRYLAMIKPALRYEARFPFLPIVQEVVAKELGANVSAALQAATRSPASESSS